MRAFGQISLASPYAANVESVAFGLLESNIRWLMIGMISCMGQPGIGSSVMYGVAELWYRWLQELVTE